MNGSKLSGLEDIGCSFLPGASAGYKGFHPLLGGVSTGSGVGLAYSRPEIPLASYLVVSGAVTVRGYRILTAALGYGRGPWFVRGYARSRDFPRQTYFGLGQASARSQRTSYSLDNRILGGVIGLRLHNKITVAVDIAHLKTEVASGKDENIPSIETLFGDEDTPGLAQQPNFLVVGGRVALDSRNVYGFWDSERQYASTNDPLARRATNPDRGTLLSFAVTRYRDQTRQFNVTRYEIEFQQYVPFNHGHRVLALRHFSTFTHADEGARGRGRTRTVLSDAHSRRPQLELVCEPPLQESPVDRCSRRRAEPGVGTVAGRTMDHRRW